MALLKNNYPVNSTVIFFLLVISFFYACSDSQSVKDQEVEITEEEFKDLGTAYQAAEKVYTFSRQQRDFASYIERENIDIQELISTFHKLEETWKSINDLKNYYNSSGEVNEAFTLKLETLSALQESAIGIVLKLDKFLGEKITALNEEFLTDELIRYYELLKQNGYEVEKRLKELLARKDELRPKPDAESKRMPRQSAPWTLAKLQLRYKSGKPCPELYTKTEGSNKHICYHKWLMDLEQFPGLLQYLSLKDKEMRNDGPRSTAEQGLAIDNHLVALLDQVYHFQTRKCGFDHKRLLNSKGEFEKTVDEVMEYFIKINHTALLPTTRDGRIAYLLTSKHASWKFKRESEWGQQEQADYRIYKEIIESCDPGADKALDQRRRQLNRSSRSAEEKFQRKN